MLFGEKLIERGSNGTVRCKKERVLLGIPAKQESLGGGVVGK